MTRYILIIFLTILSFDLFAQDITVDRIEDDGRRQLMSSGKKEKLDGVEYQFTVKAYEQYGSIDWCLLVSSFNYIPNNAMLLIKLSNSEVMSLPINNLHIGQINQRSYSYSIGNISYFTPSRTADYYSAIFALSEEQFCKIEELGIIKIRISSRSSYNEKSWGKDKLGKFISKCRKLMVDRFSTTSVKQIYDDF